MRDRLLLCLLCGALPFASLVVSADDGAPAATDTATLKITFTVPERIQAAARVTTDNNQTSSVCLTTLSSSAFAVNAVIREGVDWKLAPVSISQARTSIDCDGDLSQRLDLNASWYAANGTMTLLVSPL